VTGPSPLALQARDGGVQFAVKVVPGSSRDRIAGLWGASLKLAVAAPPERGRANAAVCELLAAALGVAARSVTVVAGSASPRKQVFVHGVSADQLLAALAPLLTKQR
jgi:uncharacterized protein (TIGR00251 family)